MSNLTISEAEIRVRLALGFEHPDPLWVAGVLAGVGSALPEARQVAAGVGSLDAAHLALLLQAYSAAVVLLRRAYGSAPAAEAR